MTRLTEEMVIARSRQSDLASIKKLNCWGSELSDVSIIRRMRDVEVLALSVNKISGLGDFEDCQKLQELYLRKNNIKDINELGYLQGLRNLKHLWLEENPCVENAGPNYRKIVLRALPNLEKLDNVDVTPEEVQDAMKSGGQVQREEEVYEDAYTNGPAPEHYQQPPPQQTQPHQQQQQPPPTQQQQQWRGQSPVREQQQHQSPENTEECMSDPIERNSIPSSPLQQRSPPNQEYSPAEPNSHHPPSPKYNPHRNSYHQSYDRSPGSDQDSPVGGNYRERTTMSTSISTHSMKEYYQGDRPVPAHYRHSQSDLTEWDENNHQGREHHPPTHRRSGPERDFPPQYPYRNGSRDKEEWEDGDRVRRDSRRDGRFSDTASVMSNAVLNHYAGYHRRPVNRSSNLLSATLCLVKELDYSSLEVVEHAVRCRIDELAAE